jgi:hypothetical protein
MWIFDLQPMRRPPRAIKRAEPLGDDAFTAQLADVLEEDVAVAFENLIHDNPGLRTAHQFGQLALTVLPYSCAVAPRTVWAKG